MAKERRDSKNRILNKGEYQKSDGRHVYRFKDGCGIERFVYSWTLTQTDRAPKGKHSNKCLREMEMDIAKDLLNCVNIYSANSLTLNNLWDKYINEKIELKPSTKNKYILSYNAKVRSSIGMRKISQIKHSDIKLFYYSLLSQGMKVSSLSDIQIMLHPVFEMAIKDDYIRSNPTSGVMRYFKKRREEEEIKRHALTEDEQEAFITYIKNHPIYSKHALIFTILLETGCRIGEALALSWQDCDFENEVINVKNNLVYFKNMKTGVHEIHIQTSKSKAGIRQIPILKDVKRALLKEYMVQMEHGFSNLIIDHCSGFIFCNKSGGKTIPNNVQNVLKNIIKSYNVYETNQSKKEHRAPLLLPNFSPHILRHTFCTRLCENGVNIKVVQEIMGHSDISTTMNIYNEATLKKKKEAFNELEGKIHVCCG